MTALQLKTALKKIQSEDNNIDVLRNRYAAEHEGQSGTVTDEMLAEMSAAELYSDELLAALNDRMEWVLTGDMSLTGDDAEPTPQGGGDDDLPPWD